jgi:hypothetical protein
MNKIQSFLLKRFQVFRNSHRPENDGNTPDLFVNMNLFKLHMGLLHKIILETIEEVGSPPSKDRQANERDLKELLIQFGDLLSDEEIKDIENVFYTTDPTINNLTRMVFKITSGKESDSMLDDMIDFR